ncbi:hypothetical protein BAY59_15150 [Prauserella coralliicola]|nr:hypothetical protein BAY59_15150 [Prauserella coralliicola]
MPRSFLDDLRAEGWRRLAEAAETAAESADGVGRLTVTTEFQVGGAVAVLRASAPPPRGCSWVGTRGLRTLTATLVGSVATALVSHARCPVAVVRGRTPEAEPPAEGPVVVVLRKHEDGSAAPADVPVVVGVDGSRSARRRSASPTTRRPCEACL